MRKITFTVYPKAQVTKGEPYTLAWEKWLELFSKHEIRGNPCDTSDRAALDKAKNGSAIVLGEIPKTAPRRGVNVLSIHAGALDLENLPDDRIEKILKTLSPFEHFIWTTHKHGSEVAGGKARLRVLLPLAEAIEPKDHPRLWAGLNELVGGANDAQTKDIGRLHFLPSTFDPSVAWTLRNPGRWLALDDLPDANDPRSKTPFQDQTIENLKFKLRVLPKGDPLKAALLALLSGEPFADLGSRHDVMLSMTFWLALKNRHLTPSSIASMFQASLGKMGADAPTVAEAQEAYKGAVGKLDQQKQEHNAEVEKEVRGCEPYTDDDLKRIAKANGWALQDLKDKWIIQKDGSGWFLTETGDYAGPYSREDMGMAATKFLSQAPIRLIEFTKSGYRYRNVGEVAREAGSLADRVISDLTIQRTRYNPQTRTMHEAILPLRFMEPKFDPDFDKWLHIATGAMYSKIVDWLACCPDLNKLLCAIYFDGAPSSGKTMFAHGVAKVWTDGPPADIASVISDFNDELARCPLVIADEEIPHSYRQTATTFLRSMLSTTSRTLKRKYKPTSEVRGALRLVLTANNEFLLDNKEVSSAQDLDAIAQRFLYVHVGQEAADFLGTLSRERKEEWVKEGIAAHIFWLSKNHVIEKPGNRFWVEGDISQMHRLLMTGSKWNSLACEWLVKYLMNPEPFDGKVNGLVRRMHGQLLVNDEALSNGWTLYLNTKQECETAKIGAALRAIAKTSERKQIRFQGRRIRYREIDIEHLISWSERYGIGDKETMLARLEGALDAGPNVVKFERQPPSTEADLDEEGNLIY
jgi:hypothetical protein